MARWRLVPCVLLLASWWHGFASANPVPQSIYDEMNRLPLRMTQQPSTDEEARFIALLAQFGVEQSGLYRAETALLFREKFDLLKPYFMMSQRIGGMPQHSIQRLFRELGSPGDREQMCRVLREWLTVPDGSLRTSPAHEVISIGRHGPERDVFGPRCLAAEMLSDWADRPSLPLIEELLQRVTSEQDSLSWSRWPGTPAAWILRQSARRLEDPGSAKFLEPNGSGRVTNFRPYSDLVAISAGRQLDLEKGSARKLSPVDMHRVWTLIGEDGTSGVSTGWVSNGYGIRLDFRSGLYAILSATEKGRLVYTDNGRLDRLTFTLEDEALHNAVAQLDGAPRR